MLLNYNPDIQKKSTVYTYTPTRYGKSKFPFYINELGHFFSNESYRLEREGVDFYYLIYTVSGCGKLNVGNTNIKILPNHAVLVNCMQYHSFLSDSEEEWEHWWVQFNGICMDEYNSIINNNNIEAIKFNDINIVEIFNELMQCTFENTSNQDVWISYWITTLLTNMVQEKEMSILYNSKQSHEQINEAISYILNNYNTDFDIEELASTIHLSKYHFIRLFKKITGISPYDYIINYRINVAKKLLKTADFTVQEISELVGFNDVNNFIKRFKQRSNCTPTKYRNELNI